MYSIVLMVAMTGGVETPSLGFRGCNGCNGCFASCKGCSGGWGCSGCWGGCSGCWGGYSSCHGCYSSGKGCNGGFFGRFRKGCNGCHGCYSSCHGCYSGCHGCYSGCHGCYSGCHGCMACTGYHCHGAVVCHGCTACAGVCTGVCHGCMACTGCACTGVVVTPVEPGKQEEPKKEEKKEDGKTIEGGKKNGEETSAPATIVVNLPANARLMIDGAATKATSARRVFVSPALEAGKAYSYTLKAEYNENGQPVVITRDVAVRAGTEITVSLHGGTTAVASR